LIGTQAGGFHRPGKLVDAHLIILHKYVEMKIAERKAQPLSPQNGTRQQVVATDNQYPNSRIDQQRLVIMTAASGISRQKAL
jgi:hypothetical protein